MSQQRYFHKVEPRVAITLSNGSPWKNWTVIDNHNGVIAPQAQLLTDSLDLCVKKGIGGVTEISKAQFDEWLKKKLNKLPRIWRDELFNRAQTSVAPPPSLPSPASPSPRVDPVVATDMRPVAEE